MLGVSIDAQQRTLIFDGDCGLCARTVALLARFGAPVEMVRSVDWPTAHPSAAQLDAEVWLVGEGRGDRRGAEALAEVAAGCRHPVRVAGWLLAAPGVRVLAAAVYRTVAARRARLSAAAGWGRCSLVDQAPRRARRR